MSFLYLIPGSISERWKTVMTAMYNGFDSHNGHDSHEKFNALGQAEKGLIILEDLLLADTSMVFHFQQCRHIVCRVGACLDDLHGCGWPSG